MTPAEKILDSRSRKEYAREVERSIKYYNMINQNQPVHTRQMTCEEFENAFGKKTESCHKLKVSGKERV